METIKTRKREELEHLIRVLVSKHLLEEALNALHKYLLGIPDSQKHRDAVVLLESRLSKIDQDRIHGVSSEAEISAGEQEVARNILSLLEIIFIDTELPPAAAVKPVQKGVLLHNVPRLMRVLEEVECRIRIAADAETAREDFPESGHIQVVPLNKIGEKMEVRMESSTPGAFKIKAYAHARQLVEPEAYTEWVFGVTPLQEGNFILRLKITVIVDYQGEKLVKDHIATVNIQVATVVEQAPAESWTSVIEFAEQHDNQKYATVPPVLPITEARKKHIVTTTIQVVSIIVLAMLAWLTLREAQPQQQVVQEKTKSGPQCSLPPVIPSLQTATIFIHTIRDSLIKFSVSETANQKIVEESPGNWRVDLKVLPVPPRPNRTELGYTPPHYEIRYSGARFADEWDLDTLISPVHLYPNLIQVFKNPPPPPPRRPQDTNNTGSCLIDVSVDTIVSNPQNWRLHIDDYRDLFHRQHLSYPAEFLQPDLYRVRIDYDYEYLFNTSLGMVSFSFENGDLKPLHSIAGPLLGNPANLKFNYLKTNPNGYGEIKLIVRFSTPVAFRSLLVNGDKLDSHQFTLLSNPSDQGLSNGFIITQQYKYGVFNRWKLHINGLDCHCEEALIDLPPNTEQEVHKDVTIKCSHDSRLGNVWLSFEPDWRLNHLRDLSIELDGQKQLFKGSASLDDAGRFKLRPPDHENINHTLCVYFRTGAGSNKDLKIACADFRFLEQNVTILLTDDHRLKVQLVQ